MTGMIHVRPAGTSYPYSQVDYDHQIKQATTAMLRDGRKLAEQARDESSNQNVTLGIGDDMVSVMRYFPQHIVIHLSQTIT